MFEILSRNVKDMIFHWIVKFPIFLIQLSIIREKHIIVVANDWIEIGEKKIAVRQVKYKMSWVEK